MKPIIESTLKVLIMGTAITAILRIGPVAMVLLLVMAAPFWAADLCE